MVRDALVWLQTQLGKGAGDGAQSWSEALLGSLNFWSLLEGTHLLSLMLFAGTIFIVDLRLLGVVFRRTPVSVIDRKVLPLTIVGFLFMLTTGLLLFFAKPLVYYHNLWFRLKLGLILIALANIGWFHLAVSRGRAAWDRAEVPPLGPRLAAAVSLTAWIAVICAGRFIAYNWFDCGKPLPAWVNAAQECAKSEHGAVPLAPRPVASVAGGAPVKPITFAVLFPHLRGWVQHLIQVWPAYVVKPNFAVYEVFHIFAIVLLGGTSVLIGLRLVGKGLTEEPASEIYRNLSPWLHLGVVGIVASGVLIGMANAERLYDSAAFLAKMLALAAGIVLTYGVVRPTALADGRVSGPAYLWAAVAAVLFAGVLWVFVTGGLITPGLFHPLTAAALVVLVAVGGRARWVYATGVAVLLLAMWAATHVFIAPDDLKHSDPANVTLACLFGAWVIGFAVWRASRGLRTAAPAALTQTVGYASILVWVTAAAAGRWIAFA